MKMKKEQYAEFKKSFEAFLKENDFDGIAIDEQDLATKYSAKPCHCCGTRGTGYRFAMCGVSLEFGSFAGFSFCHSCMTFALSDPPKTNPRKNR